MGSLWKYKDEGYLIVGFTLLVLFSLFLLVGLTAFPDEDPTTLALTVFIIFLIMGLPGIFLVRAGIRARKKQSELEKLALYIKKNHKISISKLSDVIDESEIETVSMLEDVVEKGMVKGTYQEEDGKHYFVSEDSPFETGY